MPTTEENLTGEWTLLSAGVDVDYCPRGSSAEAVVNTSATAPAKTAVGHWLQKNESYHFELGADERLWVRTARTRRGGRSVKTT